MSKLAGKVAVVTGASKGIGAGIAKALAQDGAAVVVNYASSKSGADAVVAAITSADKWRRQGWYRRSARNLCCLALWFLGVPPRVIARVYG